MKLHVLKNVPKLDPKDSKWGEGSILEIVNQYLTSASIKRTHSWVKAWVLKIDQCGQEKPKLTETKIKATEQEGTL